MDKVCCDCNLWPQWFSLFSKGMIHPKALLALNNKRWIWFKIHRVCCKLKKYCDLYPSSPGLFSDPHFGPWSGRIWKTSKGAISEACSNINNLYVADVEVHVHRALKWKMCRSCSRTSLRQRKWKKIIRDLSSCPYWSPEGHSAVSCTAI